MRMFARRERSAPFIVTFEHSKGNRIANYSVNVATLRPFQAHIPSLRELSNLRSKLRYVDIKLVGEIYI